MNRFPIRLFISFAVAVSAAGCSVESKKARLHERAGEYFKAAQYDKAEIEYMNVLRLDPQDLKAIENLGAIWHQRGAFVRALPFLNTVRLKAPGNRENHHRLLEVALALGKPDVARREALELLSRHSEDKEALLVLARTVRSPEDQKTLQAALERADRGSLAYHLASARLALLRRDAKAASAALQRARGIDAKSPEVHTELANYHLALNETEEAAKALETASDLAPLRSPVRIRYAEFLMQSRAHADADAQLKEITEKAPDYLPAWRGRASVALAESRFAEADGFLREVFRRDSSSYEGRIIRAKLWLTQGESQKAIEDLEKLGAQNPALAEDKFLLAHAYVQRGDTERALAVLEQGIRQNPHDESAMLLFARLNLSAGKAETAAGILVNLLRERPNLTAAQSMLLQSMRELGRLDEVAAGIRKQIQAAPDRPEPHRLLALVLKQQGKTEEARKSLERSHELSPGFLPVVTELVGMDLQEKKFEAALQRARNQVQQTPDSAAARVLEGGVLGAQGNWDKAEEAALKAIEIEPDYGPAYQLLNRCFLSRKPTAELAQRLEEFATTRVSNQRAVILAGTTFTAWKMTDRTRSIYEKHLAAKPDSAAVLNNLAMAYVDDPNHLNKAVELARKARKLEPRSAAIADTLGWVLYKRKDYEEALTLFKECVARMPQHPEMQYHLGLASQALGRHEAAKAAFEAAAKSPAPFAGKEEIPERLKQLAALPAPENR